MVFAVRKNSQTLNFDVIIIGGGAAGLSAALWCDELGLSALLLEKSNELGGQLLWTYNPIKNYPGIETETGRELLDVFLEQLKKRQFTPKLEAEISEIDVEKKQISLADGAIYFGSSIIIATGVRRRKLNVEGEEKFIGRGIIESGKKDAETARKKRVVIVGGGDAAFENALILAENASSVTIVHRRKSFRARREFVEQVRKNPKISIFTETVLQKINGCKNLEEIELKHLKTGETMSLPTDVLLCRIGVEPNTEILRGKIKLDKDGYVKINRNCETNIKGVFAIGDVANPLAPTISSAVGMGATAVKAIYSLLNH
jgi:thioredoxin reductase (NADPH)